ncbi:NUDIX domain-containing protein [Candidatus Pacearchaeota archaeon]|nr:NUDIX domain-containing protein [Candidatus Pacearchaeota archaeon]
MNEVRYGRRVSLFALRDKDSGVLLQHRDDGAPILPNYWAFFGGGIEEGESPEEAVRREAREELGIELRDLRLFRRYESDFEKYGLVEEFVFTAPLLYDLNRLKVQLHEGDNLGLFSFEELGELKIHKNNMFILKDLFEKHKTQALEIFISNPFY